MERRIFNKKLLLGLFAGTAALTSSKLANAPKGKKPQRLKKGDTIGIITPASYVSDEELERTVTNMESFGLRVKMGKHIRAEYGFVAGTDAQRLEDLHQMFADTNIAAVWCARGGYGTGRLLPEIDYKLIKKNPKVLMGYSDITALLQAVYHKAGLICFHGPNAGSKLTDYAREHLSAVLMEGKAPHVIPIAVMDEEQQKKLTTEQVVIRSGRATGKLVGGNLSLLAASAGTAYAPDVKNNIVLIEDVGEKPYRIDRMLTQIRQAYPLKEAAAIALGMFNGCEPDEDDRSLSLIETLKDRLSDLNIPVLYGLSFGHMQDQSTLPIGIEAQLDTAKKTITLLESAVL